MKSNTPTQPNQTQPKQTQPQQNRFVHKNVMDAVVTYIKIELMNAQHWAKHAENVVT